MYDKDSEDNVEIISTQDEKIKLIGEIFSNDSCRKILKTISDDNEMTANEIAQKNDMSLTLTIHHLKRMQTAGMIKISKTGISAKGHKMKYYVATNQSFLITPEKSTHVIIESLKKFSKFAAIGLAGFVSWVTLRPDDSSEMQPIEESRQNEFTSSEQLATDQSDTEYSASISESEPMLESESSQSGVEYSDFSDSDAANTALVDLDGTVYPQPFDATGTESVEPIILSIITPIAIVVGGIVLERILTRWYNKRRQSKKLSEEY